MLRQVHSGIAPLRVSLAAYTARQLSTTLWKASFVFIELVQESGVAVPEQVGLRKLATWEPMIDSFPAVCAHDQVHGGFGYLDKGAYSLLGLLLPVRHDLSTWHGTYCVPSTKPAAVSISSAVGDSVESPAGGWLAAGVSRDMRRAPGAGCPD